MRAYYVASSLILFLIAGSVSAAEPPRIGVVDLVSDNVGSSELRLINDRLRHRLGETGHFAVVERRQMDRTLGEAGWHQTGPCEASCAVEIGRLLGAESMVFGSIGRIGRLYLVQARIVDVESGVTIGASTRECRCDLEEAAVRLVDEVSADLAAATRGFSGAPPDSAGVGALREEQKTGAKEGTPWAWIAPAYIIVWAIYLLVWW